MHSDQPWSHGLVRHGSSARFRLMGAVGVLALGLAWGALCRFGDVLPPAPRWVFNIGGTWALLAFVVGALTRAIPWGVGYGALALAAGVASYYGVMHFSEGQANSHYLLRFGLIWLIIAVAAGALFGAAGASWVGNRRGLRIVAVALLSGVLLAEGLRLHWLDILLARAIAAGERLLGREYDPTHSLVPAIEALPGVVLPALLLQHRREAVVGSALASILAILALGAGWLLLTALRAFLA